MRRKRISETVGNIDPRYIDEAARYTGAPRAGTKKVWYKWAAAAACLALACAIGLPFAKDLFVSPDQKNIVDAVVLVEYDDSYLEIIEDANTIKKFGLPSGITDDVIGGHIVYLQKSVPEAEYSNYVVADETTDMELLEYKPAPYKAVRILRDGDRYCYAWFCNYLVENDESLPIQTVFDVYGIDEAADIVSITPVKSDNYWKANGKTVTDSAIINEFYAGITKLTAFSFDEYHAIMYADNLKKAEDEGGGDIGPEVYSRVADDRKDIVIQTKEGLRFAVQYYPSYGWISITKTLSYYQMSLEIKDWFEANIK
ncbi:MAG: hypothetical protein IJE90_03750 [Clostridia bacterium]|nr:hypothetical protein [Clostridia bacterium]